MPDELTDEQRAAVEALAEVIDAAAADDTWECEHEPTTASTRAVYVISVAAELAGVHPQTLRIYERKGLLDPSRTGGGSRRFSEQDLDRLRHIQDLTNAGLNLEGVRRVHRARGRGGPAPSRARRAPGPRPARRWPSPTASTAATWCRCRQTLVPTRHQPARPTARSTEESR